MRRMLNLIVVLLFVISFTSCIEDEFDGKTTIVEEEIEKLKVDNENLGKLDVDSSSYEDVVNILGEPSSYSYREEILEKSEAIDDFYMDYDGQVVIKIQNKMVDEIRIYDDRIRYLKNLYVGQAKEEALSQLSPVKETYTNIGVYYESYILYNDINYGYSDVKGVSYYSDPSNGVRLWFDNNAVSTVYYFNKENYLEHESKISYLKGSSPYDSGEYVTTEINGNDVEFETDADLLGKWEFKDYVYIYEDFDEERKLSNIQFIDLDIRENGIIKDCDFMWTKGYLVNVFMRGSRMVYRYELAEREGETYLLLYTSLEDDYNVYVFKNVE
ncbi:MAG: hypothetical protein JEZ08_12690 [Clostridiales bacterium]|nr:hypothetical protein [Clostridiales bacterium]